MKLQPNAKLENRRFSYSGEALRRNVSDDISSLISLKVSFQIRHIGKRKSQDS